MTEYTVKILDTVIADIDDLANYIVEVSTPEHAAKYARELQAEIKIIRDRNFDTQGTSDRHLSRVRG